MQTATEQALQQLPRSLVGVQFCVTFNIEMIVAFGFLLNKNFH